MAKLLGKPQFSGRTGNLVHATWNGKPYVRMRPHWKGRYKPTPAQILNQKKFKFAMLLMREFRDLLKLTVEFEIGQSASSSAMKVFLNEAITGVHPELSVDYPKLIVAKGSLPSATSALTASVDPAMLKFSWTDETDRIHQLHFTNHVMMVAYNEKYSEIWYELNGPRRMNLQAEMKVPEAWRGDELHTWISFRSTDFKLKANSVYTGLVRLA
jgi:hypothetical protein